MKKIATDIGVFVTSYFSKQRPFEIMQNGRMVKRPIFPNTMTVRKPGHSGSAQARASRDTIISNMIENSIPKPLFIEGDDYRIGTYFGDIYEKSDAKYHLFRITREPAKELILPDPLTGMTSYIKLIVVSPNGRVNNVQVARRGTWQEDIDVAEEKIKQLMTSLPGLVDNASAALETYARAYYAMAKINSVGGNNGKLRMLPLKP